MKFYAAHLAEVFRPLKKEDSLQAVYLYKDGTLVVGFSREDTQLHRSLSYYKAAKTMGLYLDMPGRLIVHMANADARGFIRLLTSGRYDRLEASNAADCLQTPLTLERGLQIAMLRLIKGDRLFGESVTWSRLLNLQCTFWTLQDEQPGSENWQELVDRRAWNHESVVQVYDPDANGSNSYMMEADDPAHQQEGGDR